MATTPNTMKLEEMIPFMRDGDKVSAKMFKKFINESNLQSKLIETKSVMVSLLRDDIPEVLKECESTINSKLQSCDIKDCQKIGAEVKTQLDKYRRAFNENDGDGISNDQSHDLNLMDLLIIKSSSRKITEKAINDMDLAMEAYRQTRPFIEEPIKEESGISMKWIIIAGVFTLVILIIGLMIWYFSTKKEKLEDEFQKLMIDRVLNQ